MKKKIFLVSVLAIVVILSLFAFTACNNSKVAAGTELITNGSFENFSDKTFEGWETVTGTASNFKFGQGTQSDSNDHYMYIDNSAKLYTYLKQTVAVEPNSYYVFSVDIWVTGTSDIKHDYGAYVSFLENTGYVFAQQVKHTDSFVTHTFYVCPKNTDYLTVALCLGSAETGATGHVCFDNVSMMKIDRDNIPEGATIVNFRKAKTVIGNTNASGIAFVTVLSVCTVALFVGVYLLLRRMYAAQKVFLSFNEKGTPISGVKVVRDKNWAINSVVIAAAIALGAFLIRLIMLLCTYGIQANMTTTILNADALIARNGVRGYLAKNPTSTYSPGTMYLLALLGGITSNLSFAGASVIFRLVNVLADVAIVLMIYFYGKKKVGNKLATVYASLYAVLPFTFAFTGMANTFEPLLTAMLLGSLILAVNKKYLPTYLLMTLAAVFDVRALAIAPIIVAYFAYMYYKDNAQLKVFTKTRATIIFGLVATIPLAYLLTLPVGIDQIAAGQPFFNLRAIGNPMLNGTVFTSDGFNLYGMVAMNNMLTQTSVNILNLIFILVLEAYVISLYFKNRNKQEIILLAAFTLAVMAVFTVKVNYTYLFLSIALAFVYTMISGEKRMYIILGGYSLLGILDFAQLMNQSGMLANVNPEMVNGNPVPYGNALLSYETRSPFFIFFCVVAVLLTAYYVYVVYSITNNSKLVDIKGLPEPIGKTVKSFFKKAGRKFVKNSDK